MPDLPLNDVACGQLLSESVTLLKGVGPRMTDKLLRLGIVSLQDLLFHLPSRYQNRTQLFPIGALRPGQEALIEGEVINSAIAMGRRSSLACELRDQSGIVTIRFFHFNAAQKKQLTPGTRVRCFGELRYGAKGFEIYHPQYQILTTEKPIELEKRLTPIYPSTEGISQSYWRKIIDQVLETITDNCLQDCIPFTLIPPDLLNAEPSLSLLDTLRYLHHPPANAPLQQLVAGDHPFQRRLAFEELVTYHLGLLYLRLAFRQQNAARMPQKTKALNAFISTLGFNLTDAQDRVRQEISHDLSKPHPMLRLVQGDVGSGKTVIAALAALQTIQAGFQVTVMAPTEILAEQHLQAFKNWFDPLTIQTQLLTGRSKGKQRRQILDKLQCGDTQLIIGTHALFQSEIEYQRLGLVIIDEQHRFGVHQRLALREKGCQQTVQQKTAPHQLIMTATPIPRTLAMSAYADLDLSIIDELPPGRTPVNTVLIDEARRAQVIDRVKNACLEGRQAYWVCTLIEESEVLQCQAAQATAEMLQKELTELSVALIHGRLKTEEKANIMTAFHQGKVDLLVATTVIEVGVNVTNASLMIIENPERLGLAQLHQLRGRIGRGAAASHCVLLYASTISANGKERLRVMRETSDGFVIAEKDMQLRGPGEVLGTHQTGLLQFRIADLQRDVDLISAAKSTANKLLAQYPHFCENLLDRWRRRADYFANG